MKKLRSTAVAGAFLVATVLALGGCGGSDTEEAPAGFFGVAPQTTITEADTAKMAEGGIAAVRLNVDWSYAQPNKYPWYVWDYFDSQVTAAVSQGLEVLPFVYGTPAWVSGRPTDLPVGNSKDLKSWRTFLAALVDRYGPKGEFWKLPENVKSKLPVRPIRTWQIWNESNFSYFATPVSPEQYGKLVDASASTIRDKDPGAEVMLAGLFGSPKGPPSKAVDADKFLTELAGHVKKSSFDTIAINPYAADTAKLEKTMEAFHSAAEKSGLGDKPIEITEIGWGSGTGNAFVKGSQSAQAEQLTSALGYLVGAREQLGLERVYWFTWKDLSEAESTCSFCYSAGLFEAGEGLRPKDAWDAFESLPKSDPSS